MYEGKGKYKVDLSKLSLEAPKIVVEPPGPKAKRIIEEQAKYESGAVLYPRSIPLVPERAAGATIVDVDGNVYIDLFSGIGVLNAGHTNPVILEAAVEQLRKIVQTLDFPTEARLGLVKKLREIAPGGLRGKARVLFGSPSGGDAVEASIKLAKVVKGLGSVISFVGSYHGQPTMSLSLTGSRKFKEAYTPLGQEVHFMPYAYCYRCPFGLSHPKCGIACARYVEEMLKDPYSGISKPIAMIVEPLQGEGGIITPPEEFMRRLEQIARKHELVFIVDEVQTGFGRTGKMFCSEHYGITPDVMPIAKAIGGIGLPLAGIVYSEELDKWEPGGHAGTFRGNAVAMAAGLAFLEFLEENKIPEHAAKLGERTLKTLKGLEKDNPYVGEVRGKGLMIGLEIVKDKESKEPYKEFVDKVQKECFKRGVIVWKAGHYGNVIRFLPPLVITEELMDKALEVFFEVVDRVTKESKEKK